MGTKKEELMLELREQVKRVFPEFADDSGMVSAALVGALGAALTVDDLQKAVDLWSEMESDKNE